jgi:DNA-binding GntR family transcriptional regulator
MARRSDHPLRVVSVVDRVYSVLQERILNGDLEAGSRVHQANISQELGVSRTPVREALSRLAADGLVELLPNRGARVADVALEDMRISYEARLAIEPVAARLAAERRSPDDLKRMKAALAEQRRARTTRAAYAAIRRFHLAVVEASRNALLLRFAGSLWAGRIGLHVFLRQADLVALTVDADEHEQILNALERGDGKLAERLMYEHIAISLDRLIPFEGEPAPVVARAAGE